MSVVDFIKEVTFFFDYLEAINDNFVKYTYWWQLMKEKLRPDQKVVKRAIETRWSSRYNTYSAFTNSWKEFKDIE